MTWYRAGIKHQADVLKTMPPRSTWCEGGNHCKCHMITAIDPRYRHCSFGCGRVEKSLDVASGAFGP